MIGLLWVPMAFYIFLLLPWKGNKGLPLSFVTLSSSVLIYFKSNKLSLCNLMERLEARKGNTNWCLCRHCTEKVVIEAYCCQEVEKLRKQAGDKMCIAETEFFKHMMSVEGLCLIQSVRTLKGRSTLQRSWTTTCTGTFATKFSFQWQCHLMTSMRRVTALSFHHVWWTR